MNISAVTKILESATCREIEGLKCFIVTLDQFSQITDTLQGPIFQSDILTKKHGFENCELRLSSLEEGKYFLCAESTPILDLYWKNKFRP
jgi:hypothetical protein